MPADEGGAEIAMVKFPILAVVEYQEAP